MSHCWDENACKEYLPWLKPLDPELGFGPIFLQTCDRGHLDMAQWLVAGTSYDLRQDSQDLKYKAFWSACKNGHLELAKWLVTMDVDIHCRCERAWLWTCQAGQIEVAKWLVSLGGVNIHGYKESPFRFACWHGHLDMAKWIVTLGDVDIHKPFAETCRRGHLETARWLLSLDLDWEWPWESLQQVKTWSTYRDSWVRACVVYTKTVLSDAEQLIATHQ